MKELIKQALDDAFVNLEKRVPLTKKQTIYVNIESVKPSDIIEFMKRNNIPEDAEFGGKPNGDDAFDEVCLCYDIEVSTTDKEKRQVRVRLFDTKAFKNVFDLLTKDGYKRKGFNSGSLKLFTATVYDMYINKDFDTLEEYYSLYFIKENLTIQ